MARRTRQSRDLERILEKYEPRVREAFLSAVRELKDGVVFHRLVESLRAGDIEGAIRALRIEPAAYSKFVSEKTGAYSEAAALTSVTMPAAGGISGPRFNLQNPEAEAWIRRNVSERVVGFAREQIEVARETILEGYQRGEHPYSIARQLVGTTRAETGVLGLDPERAARLRRVSRGMETAEGVKDLIIVRRNGSIDVRYQVNPATRNRIVRAYREGTAVPARGRALSKRQYESALLRERAQTIARTETGQAVMAARMESWEQYLSGRNLPPEAVIKTWRHGGGSKDPRPHHIAADGEIVRGLETPFVLENGATLLHPLDPEAPASEVINCTCSYDIRIDQLYELS